MIKHRTITHSFLGLLICVFVVTLIFRNNPLIILGFTVGYIGHLLGDLMTVQGIPIMYPNQKRYKLPITVTTGSFGETIIFILSVLGFIVV